MPDKTHKFLKIRRGPGAGAIEDSTWLSFRILCIERGSTIGGEVARFINSEVEEADKAEGEA